MEAYLIHANYTILSFVTVNHIMPYVYGNRKPAKETREESTRLLPHK
jgi:hypothetical protein